METEETAAGLPEDASGKMTVTSPVNPASRRVRHLKDDTGRYLIQEVGDSRLVAIGKAIGRFLSDLRKSYNAARHIYRASRHDSLPYHYKGAVPDPVANRVDLDLPEDAPAITVYKTEDGRYFTESFMNVPGVAETMKGRITEACEISAERADQYLQELDFIETNTELTEGEKILRKELKKMLQEEYVA